MSGGGSGIDVWYQQQPPHRGVFDVSFVERQRFRQWWLWAVAGVTIAAEVAVVVAVVVVSAPDTRGVTGAVGGCVIGLTAVVWLLVFAATLTTKVEEGVLRVSFFPLCCAGKVIPLTSITEARIVSINALEMGGYGIRYNSTHDMWAYTTGESDGVLVRSTVGSPFIIGSNNAHELARALTVL
ncbi:hypothetical protein Pelo_7730 [Pelomyxa schiedti]|nr:hypothetical protein Pelo_7730 [Pelomyxa schiedti]